MNWPFWLEVLARSSVLLLAAEGLRRLIPARKAAFRHLMLQMAFYALALLPLLAVVLPTVPLKFSSNRHLRGEVTVRELSSRYRAVTGGDEIDWALLLWGAGALAACLPLALGQIAVMRMVRRARTFRAVEMDNDTEVLLSGDTNKPFACGIFKRRILLPRQALAWDQRRVELVLRHELAHTRRRDVAVQTAAQLIAAAWWFQPLVWMLMSRLRLESELACDSEAVGAGIPASEYANALLAIAAERGLPFSSTVAGMARPNELEQRLRAIVAPAGNAVAKWRVMAIAGLFGAAALAAPSVSFDTQGGLPMKQLILSALLTSAGLTAANISGTIHDSNGTPVADAKVTIYNPDSAAKQEAMTGADGKFTFSDKDGGRMILRVEKPQLASVFHEFQMASNDNLNRDFTMGQGSEAGISPKMENKAANGRPSRIRVGGQVEQSNLTTKVQPIYPASAKEARVQGTVQLAATISAEGVPIDLQVISSPGDDLSQSALEAVGQWRYRPVLLNGQPIEVETVVIVNYTLSQ